MRIAGEVGSDRLPSVAEPKKEGPAGKSFTLLENSGILKLGGE